MARLARTELFAHDEIAIVHVMNRVVRRCFLMGSDPVSGKNFDHRKAWIEAMIERFAAQFGIDLLGFAVLSNHFHLILRSRPDVVETWDDAEVARRWLLLCPQRKEADGNPAEPSRAEIDQIRNHPVRLAETRRRLSDIAWWMRLLCQRIAQRANAEDGELGKFWQNRYRAVRLLDEAAVAACATYVDLNSIRAGIATSLAGSDHTSVQRRIEAFGSPADLPEEQLGEVPPAVPTTVTVAQSPPDDSANGADADSPDRFLSPLGIDEVRDPLGPQPAQTPYRCSDKGFLAMTTGEYLELLAWTVEHRNRPSANRTSNSPPQALTRLGLSVDGWCQLISRFGKLFHVVAGRPVVIDQTRSRMTQRRYRLNREARELLAAAA